MDVLTVSAFLRGPKAARIYEETRRNMYPEEADSYEVIVLQNGFSGFQAYFKVRPLPLMNVSLEPTDLPFVLPGTRSPFSTISFTIFTVSLLCTPSNPTGRSSPGRELGGGVLERRMVLIFFVVFAGDRANQMMVVRPWYHVFKLGCIGLRDIDRVSIIRRICLVFLHDIRARVLS